ncbi:MAG: sulfurtransferase [Alphaproteobacteria bacterium]
MQDWDGRALVETNWLEANLEDPNLRIVDASIVMTRTEDGAWVSSSGRDTFDGGHIPGSQFIDLLRELHDPASPLSFMLPSPESFAQAMGQKGIGDGHMVVVYANAVPWWATRFWWMLKANGHDRVAVLDGGLKKWRAEGRPLNQLPAAPGTAVFTPRQRPEMIAGKEDVTAMLAAGTGAVINALSPQLHRGESDLGYGRPGRIAGSVNLSALALIDPETGAYLPRADLRRAVEENLGDFGGAAICYCGGGIAATMDAFVLDLLGYGKVSVYDASLSGVGGGRQPANGNRLRPHEYGDT